MPPESSQRQKQGGQLTSNPLSNKENGNGQSSKSPSQNLDHSPGHAPDDSASRESQQHPWQISRWLAELKTERPWNGIGSANESPVFKGKHVIRGETGSDSAVAGSGRQGSSGSNIEDGERTSGSKTLA